MRKMEQKTKEYQINLIEVSTDETPLSLKEYKLNHVKERSHAESLLKG